VKRLLLILAFAPLLNAATIIDVDAAADRHPIDPRVYGVNFATEAQLRDLNVVVNRSGGNATTRYNWMQNATNHASDWYFESLEDGDDVPGQSADDFIAATRNAGAQPMVTIPIMGWVAKLGANRARLSSFSINKYGPQQDSDWQWFADAGNGRHPNGTEVTGNDPHDANMPVDAEYQRSWVHHLVQRWGTGGTYILDNEYSLWQETHRDVKPAGATMDEILARIIDHATAIKAEDPNAIVAAPEEWGWLGYLLSGYDQQWASTHYDWSNTPDKLAHGGKEYVAWLLANIRAHELATGKRLLDIFSLHFYPQGGEFSDDVSQSMQLRRNRSTRALWDPAYHDETWIDENVRLIPRMHDWVNANAPGIKIAITEYSWGADNDMNGATAQADVSGILGREGVDLATRWVTPDTGTPAYKAIRMYRNYDGALSTFGETSVRAHAANPDNVAAFAAVRQRDNALTIMIVNKVAQASPVTLRIANFHTGKTADRWQLANRNISHLSSVQPAASEVSLSLAPQSVTLLVIPPSTPGKRRAVR
jgi:hypothetical protein